MAPCPHCHRDTIGYFARIRSARASPATCRACGGRSFIESRQTIAGYLGDVGIPWASLLAIAAGMMLTSFWPVIVWVALLLAIFVWHELTLMRRPLQPSRE